MEEIKTDDQLHRCLNLLPSPMKEYINHCVHVDLTDAMITTSFKNAVRDLKGKRDKLTGPKGCGKTFFVVVMFCLCWLKDIPCMLLSPELFDFSNLCCSDFFNLFLNKHIEDEEEQVELADGIEKKMQLQLGLWQFVRQET